MQFETHYSGHVGFGFGLGFICSSQNICSYCMCTKYGAVQFLYCTSCTQKAALIERQRLTTISTQIFRPAAATSHQQPAAIAADYTADIILSGIMLTTCQISVSSLLKSICLLMMLNCKSMLLLKMTMFLFRWD